MKQYSLFFLILALNFTSCAKVSGDDDTGRVSGINVAHDMIVLGDKLDDPYTVENVTAALESLYPTRATRHLVKTTDMYVRFLPADEREYDRLCQMGIVLSDHPLDYEIIRDGDYYHDPEIPEGCITWQYAVVKTDFAMPDDIRYELLDECHIADSDTYTRADDGIDWAAVEREAFRLTGNEKLLSPQTRASSSFPSGSIRIIDDKYNLGNPVGVSGVTVAANVFVKIATAYTDENGNFTFDKSFASDPNYRLVFRNRRGFGIGVNLYLVPASTSTLGKNSPEGIDVIVSRDSDRNLFSRCVVNNAVDEYFSLCSDEGDGITPPPSNLRIWLFQKLDKSSAPMLQQGAFIDKYLFAKYLGDYSSIVKMFLPDVTLGLKSCDDYASIYETAMHELAHASHYMKAGKQYWDRYVYYVIKSSLTSPKSPYGVKGTTDSGYCAVGEMWGYYMQNSLFRRRYGMREYVAGLSWWFSPQILMYMEERGVSRGKIFAALESDVTDVDRLRDALLNNCPEYASIIRQSFERYEY